MTPGRPAAALFAFFCVFNALFCPFAHAMEFSTKYATIDYSEYKDMDDFLWRLGGQHIDFLNNPRLASFRIDRIADRIQAILGVIPRDLRFRMLLRRGKLEGGREAYYDHKTKAIYISVDSVSENMLAHEISHAIIDAYFPASPPGKMQEIIRVRG